MDIKSLRDKLTIKTGELEKVRNSQEDLMLKMNSVEDIKVAEKLDKDLTTNSKAIEDLEVEIKGLEESIKNHEDNLNGGIKMNNYKASEQAVRDWNEVFQNSSSADESKRKWMDKLVENGVKIEDEENLLPDKVVVGLEAAVAANPIFDAMAKVEPGQLVYQKFSSTDEAIVRGPGYVATSEKQEGEVTLEAKSLPQNQIYRLMSISYAIAKSSFSKKIVDYVAKESTQKIIDKVVSLALYDGTGATGDEKTQGFEAVVSDKSSAIHVKYDPSKTSLSRAIRANSFRASAGSVISITSQGHSTTMANNILIVSEEDYGKINDEVLDMNYSIDRIDTWLGVGQIVVISSPSKNYKPVILSKGAYMLAIDSFDKFEWYNILTNNNLSEVVTLANGMLAKPNSAIVFEADPKAVSEK